MAPFHWGHSVTPVAPLSPRSYKQQTWRPHHKEMLNHGAHLRLHSQWPHHATSGEVCYRALTWGTGRISGSTKISGSTSAHLSHGHAPRVAQSARCVGCTLAFPVFPLPLPAAKQQLGDFLYLYVKTLVYCLGLELEESQQCLQLGRTATVCCLCAPTPKEQRCMSDTEEGTLPNHGEPVCTCTCSMQTHSLALQSF